MSDLAQVVNSTLSTGDGQNQDVGHSDGDVLVIFVLWGVLLPLVAAAGLVGNTLTMMVLWRREMNSTTILYMRALVITDTGILLGSVLTLTPIACADYLHGDTLMYFKYSVYPVIRTPAYYVIMTLQQINVWLTVSVSVERYVAICHPFRASRLITRKNTVRLMVGLTVVSLVYNLPRVFAYRTVSCTEARAAEVETNLSTLSWRDTNVSDVQITTKYVEGVITSTWSPVTTESKKDSTVVTTTLFPKKVTPALFPNEQSNSSNFLVLPSRQSSVPKPIGLVPSSPEPLYTLSSMLHSRSSSNISIPHQTPVASLSTSSLLSLGPSTYPPSLFTSSLQTLSRSETPRPSSPTSSPPPSSSCLDVVTTDFGQTSFYMFYRTIMYLIIIYVLPFLPLLVLNSCLFRELMSMQKRKVATSKQEDNEANLSLVLVLIVIVFIFCQTPGLISQFDIIPSSLFISWLAFSNFLFATNSAVNFLIYTAFGRKFRRVLLRVFRHICTKESSNARWMSSMRFSQVPTQAQDCRTNGDIIDDQTPSVHENVEYSTRRKRRGECKKTTTRNFKETSLTVLDKHKVERLSKNCKSNSCPLTLSESSHESLSTNCKTKSVSNENHHFTNAQTCIVVENCQPTQLETNLVETMPLNSKSWDLDLDR